MSENAEDLQATVESAARDARDLQQIEDEKRGLDPADPRMADLSDEAVEVAERLRAKTLAQRDLAEETAEDTDAGTPGP